MKIKSLQISNILSFPFFEDITNAPIINLDRNLSILIGQNGSGKSTVLEVINFILRKILFVPFKRNYELFHKRSSSINEIDIKRIIELPHSNQGYSDFRLQCNYDFEDKQQNIRLVVEVDDIDRKNIEQINENLNKLLQIIEKYSIYNLTFDGESQSEYELNISLEKTNNRFTIQTNEDIGYHYLYNYNLFNEAIKIFNEENPSEQLTELTESFALISGYRNYNTFASQVSLGGGNVASNQIHDIFFKDLDRTVTSAENNEPSIFVLILLKMANRYFELIDTNRDKSECENEANNLNFITKINEKLSIINIRVEIKLIDKSNWNFAFSLIDTKRNRKIFNVNSLSAGEKSIIHLIFEAYGRGILNGGLIIIDEPEIHLHYQLQNEYLRIISLLNSEQDCQYIIVTHSESLINSSTINNVTRFSLDDNYYTKINQPEISTDQKWQIKILDNKRSTHAFFGSKVLLLEGDTDRYFFRALLGEIEKNLQKGLVQDITVLDINDKKKDDEWRNFFNAFGLKVFFITDLDYSWKYYSTEDSIKINTIPLVSEYLNNHPDVISKIESEYSNNTFILKEGDLEIYLGIEKGLSKVIDFCINDLQNYLANTSSSKVQELKMIMSKVTGEPESSLW